MMDVRRACAQQIWYAGDVRRLRRDRGVCTDSASVIGE